MRNANRPLPYTDDVETIPADEADDLLLSRQENALLRQRDDYQNLAFNVWHALAAHRPLGGINRVRRWAYPVSSAWRRQQTRMKSKAPTSTDEAAVSTSESSHE